MSKGFKSTQVFDWEHEPHDERPSEFAQSTGYQLHSGFYVAPVSTRRRSGGALVWLLAAGLIGLSVLALLLLVRFLRG